MKDEHDERLQAIARILADLRIGTQDELRKKLARVGIAVTQATLSRDLTQLGARRVASAQGAYYELPDAHTPQVDIPSEGNVVAVHRSHALVILSTRQGAASLVAAELDRRKMTEVLGTIAGDDTVFVAPALHASVSQLAKKLKKIWLGDPPTSKPRLTGSSARVAHAS
jgi:transcriptional regulator of arginine metabolism